MSFHNTIHVYLCCMFQGASVECVAILNLLLEDQYLPEESPLHQGGLKLLSIQGPFDWYIRATITWASHVYCGPTLNVWEHSTCCQADILSYHIVGLFHSLLKKSRNNFHGFAVTQLIATPTNRPSECDLLEMR